MKVQRTIARQGRTPGYGAPHLFEPLEKRELLASGPTGPSAVLVAKSITQAQSGSYTFTVTYSDADWVDVATIDDEDIRVVGPKGYSRGAKLFALDSTENGEERVARYKVSAPTGGWNPRTDGLYAVILRSAQVRDMSGNPANEGVLGQFSVITGGGSQATTSDLSQGVDVASFGAIADDTLDDTAAIQAAIDSLPMGIGNPTGENAEGGIVQFRTGQYIISAPIKLRSSVELRGMGTGTLIKNFSTDRSSGAIELYSPYGHGYNIGAAVKDLNIYSYYSAGIKALSMVGDLVDLRIDNVRISTGGVGIDLRNVASYHANIVDVTVFKPGTTALWIGKYTGNGDDWYGTVNRIEGFRTTGGARPGFVAERGLVVLGGDTTWIGGTLEGINAVVTPLYVHGSSSITGLWTEWPPEYVPSKQYIVFDNCSYVSMSRLINATSVLRVVLKNSPAVYVGLMAIEHQGDRLRQCVSIDQNSHLTIDTVYSQTDSGAFDDPQITVHSNFRIQSNTFFSNIQPNENILIDPTFSTFGQAGVNNWYVTWGDSLGSIAGTASVEQSASGPRLKIVVASNPKNRNVVIYGGINTTTDMIGKRGTALWRIDGGGTAAVWSKNFGAAYQATQMNTLTGARTPTPFVANDQILFVLRAAKGTYYLSKVNVGVDVS